MTKLRCRPGDIAILTARGNLGKLVRVVERADDWVEGVYGRPAWVIESLGSQINGIDLATFKPRGSSTRTHTPDRCLTPLRDELGADEMLRATEKRVGNGKGVQHG